MEDVTPEDKDAITEGIKAIADTFESIADSASKAFDAIQRFKKDIGDEDVEAYLQRLFGKPNLE